MIWTAESEEARHARMNAKCRPQWLRLRDWHRVFAWTPVFVTPTRKAWLRWVERRLQFEMDRQEQPEWYFWMGALRFYEYRIPPNPPA